MAARGDPVAWAVHLRMLVPSTTAALVATACQVQVQVHTTQEATTASLVVRVAAAFAAEVVASFEAVSPFELAMLAIGWVVLRQEELCLVAVCLNPY